MNTTRHTTYRIVLSKGDIIRLLQDMHPESLVVQALPASGGNVTIEAAGGLVALTFVKEG